MVVPWFRIAMSDNMIVAMTVLVFLVVIMIIPLFYYYYLHPLALYTSMAFIAYTDTSIIYIYINT